MTKPCGCTSTCSCAVSYMMLSEGCDPLNAIANFNPSKPGGYACGEWARVDDGWKMSLADGNMRPHQDRTVWSDPFTMKDVVTQVLTDLANRGTPCGGSTGSTGSTGTGGVSVI